MAGTQFGHISQFYQTLLTVSIIFLLIFQIISFVFNTYQKYIKDSLQKHQHELQWTKQKSKNVQKQQNNTSQPQQQFDLEKSVANYVQNQITNMQKTNQQNKQNQPDNQSQNDAQVKPQQNSPNKTKFYTVYRAFNHFINQKMAILIPILIVGILTQSTYVYSLAAFFFSFLCDLLIEVLSVQQEVNRIKSRGFGLKQFLKLLGNVFVMSIFFSYWNVKQFTPS